MTSYPWRVGKARGSAEVDVDNLLDTPCFAADDSLPGKPRSILGVLPVEY